MTRVWLTALLLAALAWAIPQQGSPPASVIAEPPEEDVSPETAKEYSFNPIQAAKELRVGNYYFKKGSYKAALRRFEEAVKWDPNSAEAYLRAGDAHLKLNNDKAAREAYMKFLDLQPNSKEAAAIRKKLKLQL